MLIGRCIGNKAGRTALTLAGLLAAMPVHATTTTATTTAYYRDPLLTTYTYPGPANAVMTIDVLASVGGSCGFATGGAPNATINAGSIDTTAWSGEVPFVPQCTAPWRIAVSSANGALKTGASGAAGYSTTAPYTVALTIPYDTGSSTGTVSGSCAVADIGQASTSTACNFKGTATTTNGLQVPRSFGLTGAKILLSAPAYQGTTSTILVAGSYQDTLIVTVSPAT
jgi:hypothetical protein